MSTVSARDKELNRLIAEAKAQKMAGHMTEEQFQEMKKFYHLQKDNPPEHLLEKYRKEEADRLKQERSRPFQQNQPAQERHRLEQERSRPFQQNQPAQERHRLEQERLRQERLQQERLQQEKEKSWEEQDYGLRKANHVFIEELNRRHAQELEQVNRVYAQRLKEAERFLQEQLHAMHIEQQKEGRRF
jgi:hypothetical protein